MLRVGLDDLAHPPSIFDSRSLTEFRATEGALRSLYKANIVTSRRVPVAPARAITGRNYFCGFLLIIFRLNSICGDSPCFAEAGLNRRDVVREPRLPPPPSVR
jgi:hypothetical protein